jgi:hypothetical protein
MKTFRVTLELSSNITYYNRDSDSDDDNNNDNDRDSDIEYDNNVYLNEYMMGCDCGDVPRYIEYAKSLEDSISIVYTHVTFKDITYDNGCIKFTFTVPDKLELYGLDEITEDAIKEWFEDNSLEDGEFEGNPGSAYIYPRNYNPHRDDQYDDIEFALIDYRDGVTIEKITNE